MPRKILAYGRPALQQLSVLHHEIVALVKRLELTPQEVQERQEAVGIIRDVAQEVWPYAQVIMFGSSATGLAHCGSDLDLVVCGSETRRSRMPPVREWLSAMKGCLKGWQLCSKVETVPNAKVPIVKCVLHQPKLAVDIAFFVMNGPNAVPFIRQQVQKYAPLRDLCLVLKCLLGQNGLQEVYTGGIGSYCLLNMIVAHLQNTDPASQHDLGTLLLGFLRRYDIQHNYATDVVAIKPGIRRNKFSRNWVSPQDPNLLSVEDPQNPSQDIGKASFRIDDVRALFSRVRYALEAHWNRPGLIREVVDIDRDRMHLVDGPVLHKGNKKRKQGHAPWQGAPGGPAEPPPNKKRKQNAPGATQNANPFPPVAAKKQKLAKSGGLQSARDLHLNKHSQQKGVYVNPHVWDKSTEQPAKRSAFDGGAVEAMLKPVKGAGTLDTWLSSGRAESSPGIGVLKDGIGGGTAVRVTPRQEEWMSGPGGSSVNGHQTLPGYPSNGGASSWAGLKGGGAKSTGVNSPEGRPLNGNNALSFAGAVQKACEATIAGGFWSGLPLSGSANPAQSAEKLTRGLVNDGGLHNLGPRFSGVSEGCGPENAAGEWKKLDKDEEGFVTRPVDGAGEGWIDGLPHDSRLPNERTRFDGPPETESEATGCRAAGVHTDREGNGGRSHVPERSYGMPTARTQTSGGELWPGATVEPSLSEGSLRLPLRDDVMPASENKVTDEAVWERVVDGNGVPVPKAEAVAALRAQRKRFLQRDVTAQALAELKLSPYAPRVREGFCQLARIMVRGGDAVQGVPAKAKKPVRVWKEVSKKLFRGSRPVGGSPVTWLPMPIGKLDETHRAVLRRAVIKLAGGDGQDEGLGGHVAAGEGAQGGADVSPLGRKAKKKRRLELRNLGESGGVNGDARGSGGQTGVNESLLPTWQSQIGMEGPTASRGGMGGSGFGVKGHGQPAGRLNELVERHHWMSGAGNASIVDQSMFTGRSAVEGGVNGDGVTGRTAQWGDGHAGEAAGGFVNGASRHWGGTGVNGAIEHYQGRTNEGGVNGGEVANCHREMGHDRLPLQGGNGHVHNSWGGSFGWQGTVGFPPGFGGSHGEPHTQYAHPQSYSRSGRPESPFVFSATRTSDADVATAIGVNQGRSIGGSSAAYAQTTGSDFAARNYANGFGGRGGTVASGASPRRAGRERGNSRGGYAGQLPTFRGRSVVNVGQHVVGDALRY
ncbi:DNA polymerase sigma subunit [Klebsormidium nitens]|uniref:DNA polymerase sigma subunit n=1 Tax=Klebsormidium nitens TaxID=105231 RepID=A0A1Y1HWP4_KLENI|nr:DNA polymerase sigma subunit [Klebsormidium nitens]|eukprot:GAQ83080.1 DNA polymerase sigma subunit [Klebsormidium nitens]